MNNLSERHRTCSACGRREEFGNKDWKPCTLFGKKCPATIKNRPFVDYYLAYLKRTGVGIYRND